MPFLPFAVHDTHGSPWTSSGMLSATSMVTINSDTKLPQGWSSLIGIVTAIIGNILISFALNIQRYAHIRLHHEYEEKMAEREEEEEDVSPTDQASKGKAARRNSGGSRRVEDDDHDPEKQTYLRSPYWWTGLILMTIGEAGNFAAYAFAPASIVSPLGVVALISNCVIAPVMLKERFRWQDLAGVVVAVGGAVTVVLSAKGQETRLGPHEIWGAVTRTEFEIYMAVTIGMIVVLMMASPVYGGKSIFIDLGLVGLIGGYTALSTKGVASMLSATLFKAFTSPVTYLLLAIPIGSAILQVRYVNKALQRFDSTQVIPVQFVMFTLSVIIGSAVLYRDFERTTAGNVGKFVGGCLLTFFGVFLITKGRPRQDMHSDGDSDEEAPASTDKISANHASDDHQQTAGSRKSSLRSSIGDAACDKDINDRPRRTSRVSFVDAPAGQPILSRRASRISPPPPIRLNDEPLDDPPTTMDDGSETADEYTPLMHSPLSRSPKLFRPHPRLQSTISTPNFHDAPPPLPPPSSSTSTPRPSNLRSATQGHFHTHPHQQSGPTPPKADRRPSTPARASSIARILPGKYTSPLSSSLSAVVAESLRREMGQGRDSRRAGAAVSGGVLGRRNSGNGDA